MSNFHSNYKDIHKQIATADFTDEQIEAITQADTREQYAGDIHDILRSYPLVTLTKMADLAAQYLD